VHRFECARLNAEKMEKSAKLGSVDESSKKCASVLEGEELAEAMGKVSVGLREIATGAENGSRELEKSTSASAVDILIAGGSIAPSHRADTATPATKPPISYPPPPALEPGTRTFRCPWCFKP
jgi:hypothetical protein